LHRESRIGLACLAGLFMHAAWAQEATPPAPAAPPAAPPAQPASEPVMLDPVIVRDRRPTDVGPMPGLGLTREEIPSNVQSITSKDIRESNSLSLTDLMNSKLQSVTVNDYQGNPFQVDVQFRGFTAGPQVGTPQGLSVFLDGIRMNEPFGDTVNWDMIPMNALSRFDVFPGSNPLFGLNTLGGALSMRTKSGFTDAGVEAKYLGGAWGRNQLQLSGGGSIGPVAGFVAMHGFAEDGWRDNSPSRLRQLFTKQELFIDRLSLAFSMLKVDSDLVGNGLIPLEDYQRRPSSVFSSPDETKNELNQYQWSAMLDVSDTFNISAMSYRRSSERTGFNGDVMEDGFEDLDDRTSVSAQYDPYCAYADNDPEDYFPDNNIPLNAPCDATPRNSNFQQVRNGANGAAGVSTGPGVVDGTPIAVATRTALRQAGKGFSLQLNWNLERHKFMAGASLDQSDTAYRSSQRLGLLDASRNFYYGSKGYGYGQIDPIFYAAQNEIEVNNFKGTSKTRSLYFSETWTPVDTLHLSASGRFNITRVNSWLHGRSSTGNLSEMKNRPPDQSAILCWGNYPDECDYVPEWIPYDPASVARQTKQETHTYRSFNPSAGVSWVAREDLNLFASYSRGARVPSVIELGCAIDRSTIVRDNGSSVVAAKEAPVCHLPNTMSGDPFLPQIRSNSYEIGARGTLKNGFNWNITAYRTDLTNDIYMIGVTTSRSYFDTIDRTRRQGIEMGLGGTVGRLSFNANYAYTEASFESTFYMNSPHNSSADFDKNSAGNTAIPNGNASLNSGFGTYRMITVKPGDTLPGVSRHNVNLTLGYQASDALHLKLGMVAHSPSFLRGNENNDHETGGTDKEIGGYYCTGVAGCPVIQQSTTPPGRAFRYGGKLPGYAIFNLTGSYRLSRDWTVLLQVNNLLDKSYFTAGRLGITPFAPGVNGAVGESGWNYNSSDWLNTTMVAPGAPRAIWIGMSYSFDPR
jgi:iron complex outermembrane recepter protein